MGIYTKLNIRKTTRPNSASSAKDQEYSFIADHYNSLDEVTSALRTAGLESSNLILGIDFTKSNEWTGNVSFNNRSLHHTSSTPNPYEQAISIIGKTLSAFNDENFIPCFGFGDATTHDEEVFSFHNDHSSCHGVEEVLDCYRRIVPNIRHAGWFQSSVFFIRANFFCSSSDAAVDIVEKSGGQHHTLVIISDGQARRKHPQEEKTIKSIANASSYPLSIIFVGVGDGPGEDMKKFNDKITEREFDNFQFVNFTEIMKENKIFSEKTAIFAHAALMKIPVQYKATIELGLLGRVTGKVKKIVPRPPPYTLAHSAPAIIGEASNS